MGIPRSPETRAKISAAMKGKGKGEAKTDAHKAAISAAMKGKGKGVAKTDAHKAAMSAAMKGKAKTDAHNDAVSAAKTGTVHDDAVKAAIAAGMRGKTNRCAEDNDRGDRAEAVSAIYTYTDVIADWEAAGYPAETIAAAYGAIEAEKAKIREIDARVSARKTAKTRRTIRKSRNDVVV